MDRMRARVLNGRMVMDEPTELPDGTEVEFSGVSVVDPMADMDPEERAALMASLARSDEDIKAGRVRSAFEFLADLKARRQTSKSPLPKARKRKRS